MVDNTLNPNLNLIPKSFIDSQTGALKVDEKLAQQVQAGIQARADALPPAEREAFLQMTANLAPEDVDTPTELDATLDVFAAAAKVASEPNGPMPALIMDTARFLARAMIEMAAEQKKDALEDRLNAREQARADLMNQAAQMDKAADKLSSGALTSLIVGVVAGSLALAGSLTTAVGGLSQIKNMSSSMKKTGEISEQLKGASDQVGNVAKISKGVRGEDLKVMEQSMEAAKSAENVLQTAHGNASKIFDAASAKAQTFNNFGQVAQSMGDIGRTGSSYADTTAQADAKRADAEGSRDAAEAQYQQQVADNKKQIEDNLGDMIKQIIDFLKQMKDNEVEAMRALTRV